MGFFNKPGKATRGFVNKVVREVDRVVMTNNQFQREYGTQPAPQPVVNPLPDEYVSNEVDHEFPHYMKRNRTGLIIPLPQYYKTFPLRFIIFPTDGYAIVKYKEYLNGFVVGHNTREYYEYVITNMADMQCPRAKKSFDAIVGYYK